VRVCEVAEVREVYNYADFKPFSQKWVTKV